MMNGFINYVKSHKGIITGSLIGLVIGILILTINFWGTLFLAICVGIGAFFGSHNRFKKKLMEVMDRILPDIFNK